MATVTKIGTGKVGWLQALRLLGLLLFVWILTQLDWLQAGRSIQGLLGGYLAVYVMLFCLMMLLRVLRLKAVLAASGHDLPYARLYHFTVESAFMGAITPGRVGEMVKIAFLKEAGLTFSRSLVLILLERTYDVAFLLLIGAFGAVYYVAKYVSPEYGILLLLILLGALVAAGLLLWYASARGLRLPSAVERRLPAFFAGHWYDIKGELSTSFTRTMPVLTAYTLLLSIVNVGQAFTLAKAFAMNIGLLDIGFAYATATLVTLLPISVSGLGTREATYIYLLGLGGVSAESAMLFSLFDGVLFAYVGLFIMSMPLWTRKSQNK